MRLMNRSVPLESFLHMAEVELSELGLVTYLASKIKGRGKRESPRKILRVIQHL